MRVIAAISTLILLAGIASAQEGIIFENLSLEEGLSQTTVRAILMDKTGYMWFGTDGGLNRYDGYEFKTYRKRWGRDDGLSDNVVTSLAEGERGYLWIGTSGGLDRLNMATGTIEHYRNDPADENSLRDHEITSLCVDRSGTLWIGTTEGLEKSIDMGGEFEHQRGLPEAPEEGVNILKADRSGGIWIGTDRALYRKDDDGYSRYEMKGLGNDSNRAITAIEEDHRYRIWVGTRSGKLYGLDRQSEKFAPVSLPTDKTGLSRSITSIYEDIAGELWIGTDGNGVIRFDPNSGSTSVYRRDDTSPHGLRGNIVLSIFGDTGSSIYFGDLTGIIWMGTFSDGVEKVHLKKPFQRYDSKSYNVKGLVGQDVRALWKDKDGTLWAGTYGDGLRVIDERKGTSGTIRHNPQDPMSPDSDRILSIFRCDDDRLLVGTDSGLDSFDGNVFDTIPFIGMKESPPVRSMTQGNDGTLWIGTERGLFRLDGAMALPEDEWECLAEAEITSMAFRDGILWVGTDDDGLFSLSLEDQTCRHMTPWSDDWVMSDRILCLMLDEKGLWIGTDLGLQRIEEDQVDVYTSENGLPSDVIKAILQDRYGNLWLSTDNGLSRMDPETGDLTNYSMGDGLQGKEFNRGVAITDRFGKIYFGGTKGCNSFYPDNISENEHIPPVVINEVSVFGEPAPMRKNRQGYNKVVLTDRQNYITIKFAALDYTAPKANEYMYRLKGFDENWIHSGNGHEASYTYLPPGRYVFSVKGANNNGVWNEEEANLEIVVIPPIWKTPMAYLLYISLLGIVLYLALKYVRNRQEKRTERRLRMVTEGANQKLTEKNRQLEQARRHEAKHRQRLRSLATALTEAEERERRQIATEVHDSIGQTLALSKIKLEMLRQSLSGQADEDISAVTSMLDETIDSTRTLTFELGTPMLYRFGFTAALEYLSERFEDNYGISIEYISDGPMPSMDDDMKAFLFRAVRELAMNTVKHAEASKMTISIKTYGDRLYVSTTDDGSGFDPKSLEKLEGNRRSFGLFSLRERIISLGGRLVIRSTPGEGTSVKLMVPVGRRNDE